MTRAFALTCALLLTCAAPAEARLGDSLAACKRFTAAQPGLHHVRLQLHQDKVMQESWWMDLVETEHWKLARFKKLRDQIAAPRRFVKEWRAGKGIDDNLLADYTDMLRVGFFFVGHGQVQTMSFVDPLFAVAGDPDTYRDVTIDVADNRLRKPKRAAFEQRLGAIVTLPDDPDAAVPPGATAVRLACAATAADPEKPIEEAALERLKAAVAAHRKAGRAVVLSVQPDAAIATDETARKRYNYACEQLGDTFGEAGPGLGVELARTPVGAAAFWNPAAEEALAYLRSRAPEVPVLAPPPAEGLAACAPAPDDGLLVAVPKADLAARAWERAHDARVVALP